MHEAGDCTDIETAVMRRKEKASTTEFIDAFVQLHSVRFGNFKKKILEKIKV